MMKSSLSLLTEPFLQLPTEDSIRVVWFTEFAGAGHAVTYGSNFSKTVFTRNTRLVHLREDRESQLGEETSDEQVERKPVVREIWRHEAFLTDLEPGKTISYRIMSITEDDQVISSRTYTLEPAPKPGKQLNILLTSDHQIKPMVAANLQKVKETVKRINAVFFAGDLVNIPDRASEWFDDNRGNAFFPCLQGRAKYVMKYNDVETTYTGGKIIQNAPIFPCIGNHEVMGRFYTGKSLNEEFNDTIPRDVALELYGEESLENNSFNTDTYDKIFSLPETERGKKGYYAITFGDVRLIVLYVTNMWRHPTTENSSKGKYAEPQEELNNPENWGYGQHIYESIAKGSNQYNWLIKELSSKEFHQAKYKVVMFHHPPHTLGDNIVPAYTDPQQIIERDSRGNITSVRYEYPKEDDYITRDLIPLLEQADVQLVFYGHSHLWNRFVSANGMHFLESSNVGNSYGAAYGDRKRTNIPDINNGSNNNYTEVGDPYGLEPVVPTIDPLLDDNGKPLPYISSNEITVFSIFDTEKGTVSSYRFDTRKPDSAAIKFDEFTLKS